MAYTTKVSPKDLVANGGSFLAADGSGTSWGKLLSACFGIELGDVHSDHLFTSRDMVFQHPAALAHFGTVILLDDTARATLTNGKPTLAHLKSQGVQGIAKSDGGLQDFCGGKPGEKLGLVRNGLSGWAKEMAALGVVGTKHRTVYGIEPSDALITAATTSQVMNAGAVLAEGMIPVLEPELLGQHNRDLDVHRATYGKVLDATYAGCRQAEIPLDKTGLKIGFVGNGQNATHSEPGAVGEATADLIAKSVPEEVSFVVFLSGGWEPRDYYRYLSATAAAARRQGLPQEIRASASRAAFQDFCRVWNRDYSRIPDALRVMELRGEATAAAVRGEYDYDRHEKPIEEAVAAV